VVYYLQSAPENAALDVDTILTTSTTSSDPLEFLGPEMADLQQLLSTIMSGNLHFTHVNM
jgi:hypothetical protein